MTFSKKKFTILVAEDDNHGFKQEHTFIFNLIDEKACKHLWKCAVEYHAFFRLRTSPRQLLLLQSANNGGLFNGFIRRGSRFRGPERTEYQTHNMSRLTTPRRSVQFERRPSQRFSRRASYAIKRKLQEQQQSRLRSSGQQQHGPSTGGNTTATTTTTTTPAAANGVVKTTADANLVLDSKDKQRNSIQHQQQQHHQNALVPSLSETKLNNVGNVASVKIVKKEHYCILFLVP